MSGNEKGEKYRNLSGVYFRIEVNGERKNVCFEELPFSKRKEILDSKSKERVDGLVHLMCETLNEVGKVTNIYKE